MLRARVAAAGILAALPVLLGGGLALNVHLRERFERHEAAPSEGRFIKAGDVEFFVQELGPPQAAVVLITHGLAAWSGLWRLVLEPSCREVRCVAVDLPPFGYTSAAPALDYDRGAQARRLWALADALGAKKISIVGHSFGGGPAAEAALQHPERIIKLVLIAPALGLDAPASKPGLMNALLSFPTFARFFVAATLANPLFMRSGLARFMADPASATEEMAAVVRRPIYLRGRNAAVAEWLPRYLYGLEPGLSMDKASYARLTMPVLLIWGDQDTTTPLPQGRALQALIPGSRLEVLPGIGHMPQLESAAKVQELLVAHLAD
mgnify:CR=1 FL=1